MYIFCIYIHHIQSMTFFIFKQPYPLIYPYRAQSFFSKCLCENSRNIPIPVYYPVNFHILFSHFINNHIIFPNCILVINGLIRNFSIVYSPTSAFNSSKLSQPSPSLTASSASCSFINSFFSARSRS